MFEQGEPLMRVSIQVRVYIISYAPWAGAGAVRRCGRWVWGEYGGGGAGEEPGESLGRSLGRSLRPRSERARLHAGITRVRPPVRMCVGASVRLCVAARGCAWRREAAR